MTKIDGLRLVLDADFAGQGGASDSLFKLILDALGKRLDDLAYNMKRKSELDALQASARDTNSLYVRAKDIGSVNDNQNDLLTTVCWLGWNTLTWHIANFCADRSLDVEKNPAPILILSRGQWPGGLPPCGTFDARTVFLGSPKIDQKFEDWFDSRCEIHAAMGKPPYRRTDMALETKMPLQSRHKTRLEDTETLFLNFSPRANIDKETKPTSFVIPCTIEAPENASVDIEKAIRTNYRNGNTIPARYAVFVHDDMPPCAEKDRKDVAYLAPVELERPAVGAEEEPRKETVNVLRATLPTGLKLAGDGEILGFEYTSVYIFEFKPPPSSAARAVRNTAKAVRNLFLGNAA